MNKHQHAHSVEPYAVDRYRIVAECYTCACDGPPVCTQPHAEGDSGRMPYRLTAYRMELHKGHDVRPVTA